MDKAIEKHARRLYQRAPEELTPHQLHHAVAGAAMERISPVWEKSRRRCAARRRAYYLSAEYLMGRLWDNNLLCMGLDAPIGDAYGKLEQIEDAALGNGGLGRLAACYLDAAATRKLPLDGYGIRYRYGLFRQAFEEGAQAEYPDDWLTHGDPWSVRREEEAVTVPVCGGVRAVPYDMPIVGYGGGYVATLRLWQAEPLTPFDLTLFNAGQHDKAVRQKNRAEDLCRVLYPSDATDHGRLLRLRQQYFFASASIQDMLRRYEAEHGAEWENLADWVTVQLNDTHPVIAIPELVRLMMERGVDFDTAADTATRVFNYTNHTVMQEAMEKWDMPTLRKVSPAIATLIRRLHRRFERELDGFCVPAEERRELSILQEQTVHMARLACRYSTRINGVAALHTEILQQDVLAPWHSLYPNKILNITNGITPRRWLMLCNPALAALITRLLGDDGWVTDLTRLGKLTRYADDPAVMAEFGDIKRENKCRLAAYLQEKEGITINPEAMLDVQVKRLHEYKRQLLNILCVLELYFEIKEGALTDFPPTVFLFGGKAAPGYARAKGIIRLIHGVAGLIAADKDVRNVLQVVFVTDYNVTYAQRIIPAADVSEQISTAGTEASGTGNMKLMLNGAVTLGTYDGANIEIVEEAGEENNYIFGARVEDIPSPDAYRPRDLYESDPRIRRCVDALVDGTLDDGGTGGFRDLHTALLDGAAWHAPDHYYVLGDFAACLEAKKRVAADWRDHRAAFTAKQWRNVCGAGRFSADRAVEEYAKEIWGIK